MQNFSRIVLTLVTAMSVTSASAENVPLTLTLIAPADPNTNRADVDFTIDVPSFGFNQTESSQTDLSGTVGADIDVDFAAGTHEASVNSISFSPGALSLSDMSLSFTVTGVGAVQINTSNLSGFLNTPGAPSAVFPPTGNFPADDHEAVLNSGTISTVPAVQPTIDFSSTALEEMLAVGTANIDVTKGGLLGLVQTYDVTLEVPFTFSSTQDVTLVGTIPATETFALSGTIVATGQFVHTVPEPTSVLLSVIGAALAIFVVRRM